MFISTIVGYKSVPTQELILHLNTGTSLQPSFQGLHTFFFYAVKLMHEYLYCWANLKYQKSCRMKVLQNTSNEFLRSIHRSTLSTTLSIFVHEC